MNAYKAALTITLSSLLALAGNASSVFADNTADDAIYSSFDSSWLKHHQYHAENVITDGATPIITWMPYKPSKPSTNVFKEIVNGQQDNYIHRWLEDFSYWLDSYPTKYKPTIALRFSDQLRGESYPWGYHPKDIKAAWRYLHDKFLVAGVNDSVDWVWSAKTNDYPGDDAVDWLSTKGNILAKRFNKPILMTKMQGTNTSAQDKAQRINQSLRLVKQHRPDIQSIAWIDKQKQLGWIVNVEQKQDFITADSATLSGSSIATKIPNETPRGPQEKVNQATAISQLKSTKPIVQPEVVGSDLLAREAEGIRKMSKKTLRKWRLEGILPQ